MGADLRMEMPVQYSWSITLETLHESLLYRDRNHFAIAAELKPSRQKCLRSTMTSRHSTTIPRSDTGFTDVAPTRSRTDPPAHRSDKERSHLHRRLHHANTMTGKDSHNQHRHRHRDRAKDTVQSAIDLKPPISFDQLLRRDRKSPLTGRHESPNQQQRDIEEWQVQQQIQQEREARARVTAQD